MKTTLVVAVIIAATNGGAATNNVEALPMVSIAVEASRIESRAMEMPSAVQVITQREIAGSGANNVVELLARKVPAVHIRNLGAGNPALAEVALRGYGENGHGRTLILVDGEQLNSPDLNTPNLARIPLNSVTKLEVLKGPQNVLLGDAASGGALNITTEAEDYERKSAIELHGGSWGALGGSANTRGGIEDELLKYWASGAWEHSEGYRANSGFDIWNLNGGLKKEWENGSNWRISAFYNDAQYELPGAVSYHEMRQHPRRSYAMDDRYHRATYGLNSIANIQFNDENVLRVTSTFSTRYMHAQQQGAGWFSDNEFDIYSYKLLPEWINKSAVAGYENEFIVGAQYAYDVLSGCMNSNAALQHPDYARNMADVFAQDTFHLNDQWALQAGGRYSHFWAFNNLCAKRHRAAGASAANFALLFNPNDDAKLYMKVARMYRNPFLDEVPARFDANYNWVNTRILKPEQGWSAELGGEWEAAEEVTLGAAAYYSWLNDEIFYNAVTGNNINSPDDTVRWGGELHAAWERDKVAGVALAANYVRATFSGGDFNHNLVPLVPEVTFTANAKLWLWDECFVFGGYRFQGNAFSCSDFNNAFAKLPWYGIFHLGLTYEPSFVSGLKCTLACANLCDKHYCDYATYGSSYYPAQGRTFTLSLSYEF